MHRQLKRLYVAFALFLLSILVGMIGFLEIEKMSVVDSFYMAIITLGSVGFTEVHELSEGGRLFTSLYIIFNLFVYAFSVSVLGQYLFEGELKNIFNGVREKSKIRKMKNHVIVCGFGRNGRKAVEELLKENFTVLVIEKMSEHRKELPSADPEHFVIYDGDATKDEVLMTCNIEHASYIITTLPTDADNVFIVLTARELNPDIQIIARASAINSEKKLLRAGANHVVMPELIGGQYMARLVSEGSLKTSGINSSISLPGFLMEEISANGFLNNSFQTSFANLKGVTGDTLLAGFKTQAGKVFFNPQEEKMVERGDILLFLKEMK